MRATARTAPAARAATSRSRLLALLVAAIAALGLVPAASALTDLRTPRACRTTPSSSPVTPGSEGGGVNIMSNQGRTLTGPWQCVELVNRLYETKGWINPGTWTGNGADKYRTAPAHLMKEPQGGITRVNPGDVVVFNTNYYPTYGHVAVVDNVIGSNVYLLQQNAQPASKVITWSGGTFSWVQPPTRSPASCTHRSPPAPESRWPETRTGAYNSSRSARTGRSTTGRRLPAARGHRGRKERRRLERPSKAMPTGAQNCSPWDCAARSTTGGKRPPAAPGPDGPNSMVVSTASPLPATRTDVSELFAVGQRGEAYRRPQTTPGGG